MKELKELYGKERFKFINPHPKGKVVGDCVKRAISLTEGRDYMEVSRELNRVKREVGGKSYRSDKVWKKYVSIKGYEKISFPAVAGHQRMTPAQFTMLYPKGTYILNMAKHLSSCVDGIIMDTWDCTDKCVYNAFKVK